MTTDMHTSDVESHLSELRGGLNTLPPARKAFRQQLQEEYKEQGKKESQREKDYFTYLNSTELALQEELQSLPDNWEGLTKATDLLRVFYWEMAKKRYDYILGLDRSVADTDAGKQLGKACNALAGALDRSRTFLSTKETQGSTDSSLAGAMYGEELIVESNKEELVAAYSPISTAYEKEEVGESGGHTPGDTAQVEESLLRQDEEEEIEDSALGSPDGASSGGAEDLQAERQTVVSYSPDEDDVEEPIPPTPCPPPEEIQDNPEPTDHNLFLLFLECRFGANSLVYKQTEKLFKRRQLRFRDTREIEDLLKSWQEVLKDYNKFVKRRKKPDDLVSIEGFIEIHSLLEILYERLIPVIEERNITNLDELLGVY